MKKYEFSKLLSLLFYKYCGTVDGWTEYSNEFITAARVVIDDFNAFRASANKQMIAIYNTTQVSDEFEQVKIMKEKWLEFVKRFSKLEEEFEEKYKVVAKELNIFLSDLEMIKVFLAEYFAYENMEEVYGSLLNLDSQIESYQKTWNLYKCQFQPT